MFCPACGNELSQVSVADILVDVCRGGCGGIWFDNFEIEKVDEQHEHAGEQLLDISRDEGVHVNVEKKRPCPSCDGVLMMKHYFSIKKNVEVDECAACGGIWLDAGELKMIREQYPNDEERQKAADEYFAAVIGSLTQGMKQKSAEDLARARRFARAFRFLCPSYYIPGDQPWGAF